MAYSTIDTKYGLCIDCADGIEKPVIAGRCKYSHYQPHRKKMMLEKRKEKNKVRSLIQQPKNKLLLADKGIIEKDGQELWYRMQMNSNAKVCDNCGLSLAHYNEWAWRSSQNHIVDKSPLNGCPSVATHPLNCNVLGMWCCHGQWGTSFLNQSKMPCFPAAKEKFILFQKDIDPDELKKVNPFLINP